MLLTPPQRLVALYLLHAAPSVTNPEANPFRAVLVRVRPCAPLRPLPPQLARAFWSTSNAAAAVPRLGLGVDAKADGRSRLSPACLHACGHRWPQAVGDDRRPLVERGFALQLLGGERPTLVRSPLR